MAVTFDATISSAGALRRVVSEPQQLAFDRLQSLYGHTCTDLLQDDLYARLGTGIRSFLDHHVRADTAMEYYHGPPGPFMNCSEVAPACGQHAMFQTLCPETCGCNDPSEKRMRLVSSPLQGCPQGCVGSPPWWSRLDGMSCTDHDPHERWAAEFAQGFSITATMLGFNSEAFCQSKQGAMSCHDLFMAKGCITINWWRGVFGGDPCKGLWYRGIWETLPLAPLCQATCCPDMMP